LANERSRTWPCLPEDFNEISRSLVSTFEGRIHVAIKPLVFLAGVSSLVAYVLLSGFASTAPVREGSPAPDFIVKDQYGREVSLSQFRGSVVFLNFWRTDCVPCAEEMPDMDTVTRLFKGRKFHMMPISLDVDETEVKRFYHEQNLTMPAYLDPGRNVASKFDILGTPETFLIDGEGKIVKYYLGPQEWSNPQMLALMEKMIP
jgi:peroxiredoxin